MNDKSEHNQNEQMAGGVSFGEPSLVSHPYSAFSDSEDKDTFATARILQFAQSVLNAEAWFRAADELIAVMDLLEPTVERFWGELRSIFFAVDKTTDAPSKHQTSDMPLTSDAPLKHGLINQHVMLAGFAIENLCRGIWRVA